MKIRQMRGELFHADRERERERERDGRTDMTKSTAAFAILRRRLIKKVQVSNYSSELCNAVSKIGKNNRNSGFECTQCCY